ncbi:MAG: hypothetical protein U1D68_02190 [Arthrobacter sp.]|nr:hypothetical protein [Arthrobacter sp.]MDZ4353120.1 hypothetical protein [Arthrobacter sp.]
MTNPRVPRVRRISRVSPARNAKIGVAGLSVSAFLALVAGLATGNQAQSVPEVVPVATVPAEQISPRPDPSSPAVVPAPAPAVVPVPASAVVPAPVRPPKATAPPPQPAAPNGTSRGSGG